MKNTKKTICTIGAVVLLLGVMLLSCISAQSIIQLQTADNMLSSHIKQDENHEHCANGRYAVFGFGICAGIEIDGKRNEYMRGVIKADLTIINGYSFPPGGNYRILIIDRETGETFTKRDFGYCIHLKNFVGIGYISDYFQSWGLFSCSFKLCGNAGLV